MSSTEGRSHGRSEPRWAAEKSIAAGSPRHRSLPLRQPAGAARLMTYRARPPSYAGRCSEARGARSSARHRACRGSTARWRRGARRRSSGVGSARSPKEGMAGQPPEGTAHGGRTFLLRRRGRGCVEDTCDAPRRGAHVLWGRRSQVRDRSGRVPRPESSDRRDEDMPCASPSALVHRRGGGAPRRPGTTARRSVPLRRPASWSPPASRPAPTPPPGSRRVRAASPATGLLTTCS